jgi:hypothetical protein
VRFLLLPRFPAFLLMPSLLQWFNDNLNKFDWVQLRDDGALDLAVPHLTAVSGGSAFFSPSLS